MICENCGKDNKDGVLFCSECGKAFDTKPIDLELEQLKIPAASRKSRIIKVNASKKSESASQNADAEAKDPDEGELIEMPPFPAAAEQPEEGSATSEVNESDPSLAPMKIKNWIPVFILGAIPVVNLIVFLVWAVSSNVNKSKKSFAITALIFAGIALVLAVGLLFAYAALFQVNLSSMMPKLQ